MDLKRKQIILLIGLVLIGIILSAMVITENNVLFQKWVTKKQAACSHVVEEWSKWELDPQGALQRSGTCTLCSKTVYERCEHDDFFYEDVQDMHKKTCNVCGACGIEEHTYESGNCQEGVECIYCHYKYTGNHEWDSETGKCIKCKTPCEHDWEVIEGIPATCIWEGSIESVCKICKKEAFETIQPLGHDWSNKDGKCAREGCEEVCTHSWSAETGKCEICGIVCPHDKYTWDNHVGCTCDKCGMFSYCEDENGPFYYEDSTNGSTCTESRTCMHCKHTYEALGHNLTKTEAKAATCTEDGNIAYWYCTNCKKYYSDSEGKTETTLANTKVNKLGHNLTKTEAKAATCTEDGNIAYWYCTNCKKYYSDSEGKTETTLANTKVNKLGHNLTKTEAKVATCTEDGNKAYWYCSNCKKYYSDSEGKTETTVEAMTIKKLGHNWKNKDGKCAREGCEAVCTHSWSEEIGTCTICGMVHQSQQEDPLTVTSTAYKIEGEYILQIKPDTNISKFLKGITTNAEKAIVKKDKTVIAEILMKDKMGETAEKLIGTGMTVIFTKGEETKEYTVVVRGDCTGDGKIKNSDLTMVAQYRVGIIENLSEAAYKAMDLNLDGQFGKNSDLTMIAQILVNLVNL